MRVYRNFLHQGGVSAIFCASLYSPLYTKVSTELIDHIMQNPISKSLQHCDTVITNEYPGTSAMGEGKSQVYTQISGDEVELHSSEETGFTIEFDQIPAQVCRV